MGVIEENMVILDIMLEQLVRIYGYSSQRTLIEY
jgi:hypothetical protein